MDEFIIWLIAIIVHEIGHLIGYPILGLKWPKFKVGFGVVGWESHELLIKPWWNEAYVVMGGVLAGALALVVLKAELIVWTVYWMSCLIDLNELWFFFTTPDKKMWFAPMMLRIHQVYNECLDKAIPQWIEASSKCATISAESEKKPRRKNKCHIV